MRFELSQKLMSIGTDFLVRDESGNDQFYFDGKVGRLRHTIEVIGPGKITMGTLTKNIGTFSPTYTLKSDKEIISVISKKLFTFRPSFVVKITDADPLLITGKMLEHEYRVFRGKDEIATVSKKWFRSKDTYGIDIEKPKDQLIVLSAVVVIDLILHPKRKS